jgi:3-hydroxyacyl-CoA dehydrogenase
MSVAAVVEPVPVIRKAAVLGAGTMGSRIAAHLANAGLPVVLLDIPAPSGAAQRHCGAGARKPEEEQACGVLRPRAGLADHRRELR